jgi:hypothetical protein
MHDRRDLLLRATTALQAVLKELDETDVCPKAAVHIQWAIDLLEKEFGEIGETSVSH